MIPRRRRICFAVATVLFLAILCVFPGFAQRTKKSPGPRAVALLEWTGHELRLVPLSLMIDGRYYDASIYHANPVPMALDQDTVYQVQRSGEAIGDFTVTRPAQVTSGAWIGQGTWLSEAERARRAEKRAKQNAAAAPVTPSDDRPVLRRSPKSSSDKPAEPPPAAAPTSTPAPGTSAPPAKTPPPAAVLTDDDSAPNRPILKRGKPPEEQALKLGNEKLPRKAPTNPPAGLEKIQVAVSDATNTDPRPYSWKWANPEEQQKFRAQAEQLAMTTLTAYAAKTGGPKPGKLEDVTVHAFDLAYNNEPDVILSARALPAAAPAKATPVRKGTAQKTQPATASPATSAPSGFEYYVTIIGREDIYSTLQKSFAAVTDNHHLDAFPRYELIDAVDAEGTGNAGLLFHTISDRSSSFVLYRVIGTRLEEILSVPEQKAGD